MAGPSQSDTLREWLGAYMDGELNTERRAWVERHLADCAECRLELDELRRLSRLLHTCRPDKRPINMQHGLEEGEPMDTGSSDHLSPRKSLRLSGSFLSNGYDQPFAIWRIHIPQRFNIF